VNHLQDLVFPVNLAQFEQNCKGQTKVHKPKPLQLLPKLPKLLALGLAEVRTTSELHAPLGMSPSFVPFPCKNQQRNRVSFKIATSNVLRDTTNMNVNRT
jgi:hypothetical protein